MARPRWRWLVWLLDWYGRWQDIKAVWALLTASAVATAIFAWLVDDWSAEGVALAALLFLALASSLWAAWEWRGRRQLDRRVEIERARADRAEEERDALSGRIEPMPAPFVTIRDAIRRVTEIRKDENWSDSHRIQVIASEIERAAESGAITVWGRRVNQTGYVQIDAARWNVARLDLLDLLDPDGSGGRMWDRSLDTEPRYVDLFVDFNELDRVVPNHQRRQKAP